ncbi:Unknown protein, partial [Striga hermonthica]
PAQPNPKWTFRDMVNKNRQHVDVDSDDEEHDANGEKDVVADLSSPLPEVKISKRFFDQINLEWRNVVVVKPFDEALTMASLYNRLMKMWPTMAGCNMMDLENVFYLIHFRTIEDVVQVLTGGPYVVGGSYMHVQPWSMEFDALNEELISTVAWIRLPGLPPHLYHKKIFRTIGQIVGKVVKIDHQMAALTRGKYARLVIMVDLTKPLCVNFSINGRNQRVIYGSLPTIYFHCGRIDHTSHGCLYKPVSTDSAGVPQRARRPYTRRELGQDRTHNEHTPNVMANRGAGSRFDILDEDGSEDHIPQFVVGGTSAGQNGQSASSQGGKEWRSVSGHRRAAGKSAVGNTATVVIEERGKKSSTEASPIVLRKNTQASATRSSSFGGPMPSGNEQASRASGSTSDCLVLIRAGLDPKKHSAVTLVEKNTDKVKLDILEFSRQFVHVRICLDEEVSLVTFIYVSPNMANRRTLWADLHRLAEGVSEPWVIGGDSNCRRGFATSVGSLLIGCSTAACRRWPLTSILLHGSVSP